VAGRRDGMIKTHKPPLVERVLLEGSLWPVVVGIVLRPDVVSPHGGVKECLTKDEHKDLNPRFEKARYRCGPWRGELSRRWR